MVDMHSPSKQGGLKFLLLASFLGLLVAAAQTARAQTETVLYSFCSQPNCTDGYWPIAGLVRDTKGDLYGTTPYGGNGNAVGTVFEVTASGAEKVLYSFCSQPNCADGSSPQGGLAQQGGNLYGTTWNGGAYGYGTVFVVTTKGKQKVLYSFTGGADGAYPASALVRDKLGNLYGTTVYGGVESGYFGNGTVYRLTPTGEEKVLHSFSGGANGANPYSGLVLDKDGNLYGTTYYGGDLSGCASGCGTVFEVTPDGMHTVLYTFTGGADDGGNPFAGVALDGKRNLYGATQFGGSSAQGSCGPIGGCGTVFEVTSAGTEKVLYNFCTMADCADGAYPKGDVVRDTKGNLYGTTASGGVFELTPTGAFTGLYTFKGGEDGSEPLAGLVRDKLGNLYGTTNGGGAYGFGTVFKVAP